MANAFYNTYTSSQPGQSNSIYYDQNSPMQNVQLSNMQYYSQQIPQTQQQVAFLSQPQMVPNQGLPPLTLSRTDKEWQIVQNKKRSRSPDAPKNQNQTDYWLSNATKISNKYASLDNKEDEDDITEVEETVEEKKEPKPPPIFVAGVGNIQPLITLLDNIAKEKYVLKALNNEQVKIQPLESIIYNNIIKALNEKNTQYHTYKPKLDKTFRVVLKNIHPSTDLEAIKLNLLEKGHEVTNIWNCKSRQTKKELPIFFLDLKQNANNKEIYKIKLFMNNVVNFEAPRPNKEVLQCTRCQNFGHSKNFCHKEPRCVKCIGKHFTKDCPRNTKDENVKCVNCSENHPANYKGCLVYKQIQQKIYPRIRGNRIQPGITYAQSMQPTHYPNNNNQPLSTETPEQPNDLTELKNMMKNLITQMGTIMNLITTLVNKLS